MDNEKWLQDRIKNGNGYELVKMAEELLTESKRSERETQVDIAMKFCLSAADRLHGDPWSRSRIYRKMGEFYESIEDIKNAITYYERALQDNSGVGVKKKLEAIKVKDKKQ